MENLFKVTKKEFFSFSLDHFDQDLKKKKHSFFLKECLKNKFQLEKDFEILFEETKKYYFVTIVFNGNKKRMKLTPSFAENKCHINYEKFEKFAKTVFFN